MGRDRSAMRLLLFASVAVALGVAAARWALGRRWQTRLERLKVSLTNSLQQIASDPRWDRTKACIILSGGLDSGIVAEVGKEVLGITAAFTVLATEGATDRPYATASAAAAGLKHHVLEVTIPELLEKELPIAVRVGGMDQERVLKSFDPMTLRNEIAVTRALSEAAKLGFTCAVTGDAADELLGGYSFTHRLNPKAWAHNRQRMAKLMTFGSHAIGKHLGLWVTSPYLAPSFIKCAMAFDKDDCVQPEPPLGGDRLTLQPTQPDKDLGSSPLPSPPLLGKVPLRLCFPEVTSCWRRKDPIEVGCGTTALSTPGWFDQFISEAEYESETQFVLKNHAVIIRDKEHLFYYRAFRLIFPNGAVPGKPRHGRDPCPACGYEMSTTDQTFCVTCGHYDPNLRSKPGAQRAPCS